MALKKKANQTQNVADLVMNFENRILSLQEDLPEIQNQAKRNKIKQTLKNLEKLASQISPLIGTADPEVSGKYASLCQQYNPLKDEAQRKINEIEQAASSAQENDNEHNNQAANPIQSQQDQEQQQIDQETAEVEYLQRETQEITEQVKALNEITGLVAQKIDEQHEVILRVDDTIEDAHTEMVKGNKELEEAKEYQKGSTKCLWIILGIVAVVIVIIIIIVLCVVLT